MEEINQRINFKSLSKITKRLISSLFLLLAFLVSGNAKAEISLITDEETEQYLAQILRPIYKEAGIPFNRNNIYIVSDNGLNAFVGDGNNMFINTGTLIKAGSSSEIKGVLAHETGHIQGGHILRQKIKSQSMQQVSLASLVLAGAAAAASGRADVGMAIMLGSQSSAMNNYLSYRVEEERSADEAAINLLNKTQQSPVGMLAFMKRIQQQNILNGIEENAYFRTHPVTSERVSFIEQAVKTTPYNNNANDEKQFAMIQAKLFSYMSEPKKTFQKYPLSNKSAPAQYAQAIAYFKQLNMKQALKAIDNLIAEEPSNPHFRELKAQMFLETGKVRLAKDEYQKALNLLPNSALFQINLAQTILEDNPSKQELNQTINILNKALVAKPNSFAWLLLSRTYGELGDVANSNYAAAEYSYRIGKIVVAKRQAEEALKAVKNPKLKLKIEDLLDRIKELTK